MDRQLLLADIGPWCIAIPALHTHSIAFAADLPPPSALSPSSPLNAPFDLWSLLSPDSPPPPLSQRRAVRWRDGAHPRWVLLDQTVWFDAITTDRLCPLPAFLFGLRALIGVTHLLSIRDTFALLLDLHSVLNPVLLSPQAPSQDGLQ
jgi:hypothetical protein